MPKNIVICSDGTGNTANKNRGTNVFKLYEALDINGAGENGFSQIAFYDDGVGTQRFAPLRLLSGAVGYGLARNVRQLYRNLCATYEEGDRIYMFGFSRGAFTVRTLAGLVGRCGIVDGRCMDPSELKDVSKSAWKAYREAYPPTALSWLLRRRPGRSGPAFGHDSRKDVPIRFIGVWDTVAAVGLPFDEITQLINSTIYRFYFPDFDLGRSVEKACQALAIDDERRTFHPQLWNEKPRDPEYHETSICKCADSTRQGSEARIEQTWFCGAHSNVGGGYVRHGVSMIALDWMMERAERWGLRFGESARTAIREACDVHDRLYDSRTGISLYYRYEPRNVEAMCDDAGAELRVHPSVADRIEQGTDGYAPGFLPLGERSRPSPEKVRSIARHVAVRKGAQYALFLLTVILLGTAGWQRLPEGGAGEALTGWVSASARAPETLGMFALDTLRNPGATLNEMVGLVVGTGTGLPAALASFLAPALELPWLAYLLILGLTLIQLLSSFSKRRIHDVRAAHWRPVSQEGPQEPQTAGASSPSTSGNDAPGTLPSKERMV